MATHLDSKGREVLFRYKEHYDELNTALSKNNGCAAAKVFHKYLALANEVNPFYRSLEYNNALDASSVNYKDMLFIDQSLCTQSASNITILRKMNDYLEPLANRLYHASVTYHSQGTKPNHRC